MIELVKKYRILTFVIGGIILTIIIVGFIFGYAIITFFIIYIIILSLYIGYSYIALLQLKDYGYVGDFCGKMKWIYIIISIVIIVSTFILFIIFSI